MIEAPYINDRGEWVDPSKVCQDCDGECGDYYGPHWSSCWTCHRTGKLTVTRKDPRHPEYKP